MQVTAYRCQDGSTARILEQIIQETTVRARARRPSEPTATRGCTRDASRAPAAWPPAAWPPAERAERASVVAPLAPQNRMNRLSQQESENEVKMFAMAGEIEQETKRAELLQVLQQHKLMEAKNEGEAEAERVRAFLAATEASVPSLDSRVGLWNVLRKRDALEAVSSGQARLYFTPNDVNLTIESKEGGGV